MPDGNATPDTNGEKTPSDAMDVDAAPAANLPAPGGLKAAPPAAKPVAPGGLAATAPGPNSGLATVCGNHNGRKKFHMVALASRTVVAAPHAFCTKASGISTLLLDGQTCPPPEIFHNQMSQSPSGD